MLEKLLNLTRPLFVFDLETTGTDPKVDRIVELGLQRWTSEGMTKEYRTLVKPPIPIPASATNVHGISADAFERCRDCNGYVDGHPFDQGCQQWRAWPTFAQLAENLASGLVGCDFAGQHVRFDLEVMAAEMKRARVTWDYVGARIVDSLRLEALAVPRSLSHLHEKYVGAKHDGAHGALSDVRAAAAVIARQLEVHASLPRDLDRLHELSWPGWLCNGGQFQLIDGVATCCFGKKWNGRPMREVDVGFWDWILREDFPADVKALAADAKLGKFPGR